MTRPHRTSRSLAGELLLGLIGLLVLFAFTALMFPALYAAREAGGHHSAPPRLGWLDPQRAF